MQHTRPAPARPVTAAAAGGTVLAEESYRSRAASVSGPAATDTPSKRPSRLGSLFKSLRRKPASSAGGRAAAAEPAAAPAAATPTAGGPKGKAGADMGEVLVRKLNDDKGKSDSAARWSYFSPDKLRAVEAIY